MALQLLLVSAAAAAGRSVRSDADPTEFESEWQLPPER